jgi:hypothetical protein
MKNLEQMLMQKKDKTEMSKEEIQAKMEVLQELMDMCKDKIGNSVKSGMDEMQKVTVAAPDTESLKLGLEKAEELTENPRALSEEMEEKSETPAEESKEHTNPFDDSEEEDDDSMFAKRK